MASRSSSAFAVWITGLPASGKSTLAAAVEEQLAARGIDVAVLESDELRKVFTPDPHYDEQERDSFYRQIAYVGALLTRHGVPVILDATANRRAYRERARQQIPRFLEVYVDSPLETCIARDPKGIYRQAQSSGAGTVPGIQATYEVPERPDLIVHGDHESSEAAAGRVIAKLIERGYLDDKPEVFL
ncbi:MAG TPA: adenylyl-sulfate kinase [Bryobacteraceae bacterium]|nr:adenylyl-sulfate kinase [Bryobacteraceae bacterium]